MIEHSTIDFYKSQIEDKFVPYWLSFIDSEYGGILNCISNDGQTLVSEDKYTWSQGRWLYILSKLIEMKDVFTSLDYTIIDENASKTAEFIISNAFDDDMNTVFRMERDGKWLDNDNPFSSIYADCFALIGLGEYAKATRDSFIADKCYSLLKSITKRVDSKKYSTDPYPIPESYKSHGIPMILLNTLEVFSGIEKYKSYCRCLQKIFFDCIFSTYYKKPLIFEYVSDNPDYTRLLDRHINPGHTLEDAWFWIEYLEANGGLEEKLPIIDEIVKSTFKLGWDSEYGGLFRFVDISGGKPIGKSYGSLYENLISDTWDMKLWWPHSEMLYLFLKMYMLTNDDEYKHMYKKVFDYSFSVFPSKENGEWNQIRVRDGHEIDKVVALPVKDPFHILRDFLKILEFGDKRC